MIPIHASIALAQFALLGAVELPNPHTKSIIIFTIGINEMSRVSIQSPTDMVLLYPSIIDTIQYLFDYPIGEVRFLSGICLHDTNLNNQIYCKKQKRPTLFNGTLCSNWGKLHKNGFVLIRTKSKLFASWDCSASLEPRIGFEPTTCSLRMSCSTS